VRIPFALKYNVSYFVDGTGQSGNTWLTIGSFPNMSHPELFTIRGIILGLPYYNEEMRPGPWESSPSRYRLTSSSDPGTFASPHSSISGKDHATPGSHGHAAYQTLDAYSLEAKKAKHGSNHFSLTGASEKPLNDPKVCRALE